MKKFLIETERLTITEFNENMAQILHENSLDEDNRRFVPDEVFETVEEAHETIVALMQCYEEDDAPLVYPVLLKNGENIGHVQIVPLEYEWEIGYHIAKQHTGNGYATEAIKAFLPIVMERLDISRVLGIVDSDNAASCAVLEKCGFVLERKVAREYHGGVRMVCQYLYLKGVK